MIRWTLLCLCLLYLLMSVGHYCKEPGCLPCTLCSAVCTHWHIPCWAFSSQGWTALALSAPLQRRGALIIFVAHHWGLFGMSVCLLYWGLPSKTLCSPKPLALQVILAFLSLGSWPESSLPLLLPDFNVTAIRCLCLYICSYMDGFLNLHAALSTFPGIGNPFEVLLYIA